MEYWQYKVCKPFLSLKNKHLKRLAKKESKKFDLYHKTVLEIGEYTNESPEVVRQKYRDMGAINEPGNEIFQKQDNLTADAVEQFYKGAEYYLYELPLWNAERARPKYLYRVIQPYLKKYGCHKLLDFGGGTGDFCLELASHGFEMSYCDIGERVSQFAKWRFKKRNYEVKMFGSLTELQGNTFDAVISFDCLEHIKDLEQIVCQLAEMVRKKGLMIIADAFEGDTLHLKENQKYHDLRLFSSMLSKYNLKFVGRFAQYVFYQKVK